MADESSRKKRKHESDEDDEAKDKGKSKRHRRNEEDEERSHRKKSKHKHKEKERVPTPPPSIAEPQLVPTVETPPMVTVPVEPVKEDEPVSVPEVPPAKESASVHQALAQILATGLGQAPGASAAAPVVINQDDDGQQLIFMGQVSKVELSRPQEYTLEDAQERLDECMALEMSTTPDAISRLRADMQAEVRRRNGTVIRGFWEMSPKTIQKKGEWPTGFYAEYVDQRPDARYILSLMRNAKARYKVIYYHKNFPCPTTLVNEKGYITLWFLDGGAGVPSLKGVTEFATSSMFSGKGVKVDACHASGGLRGNSMMFGSYM